MQRTSILIVDDDPGARDAFEPMLKANGYEVRTAADATSAFCEIERRVPAVILLDLHLPVIDALEFLRRVRSTPRHADIPIAVVTGDYLIDERVSNDLERLGARLHFKPLWEEDVIRILHDLVTSSAKGGVSSFDHPVSQPSALLP